MRVDSKGRFAVAAMVDLALRARSAPVVLAAIGQRQQISVSCPEQFFGRLSRHKLVRSTRDPGRGYPLGRQTGGITVADIITAVEGQHGKTNRGDDARFMP